MMITKEDIFDETIRVLRQELAVDQKLTGDMSLQSLGLDSLQLMQIFVYLEERFGFDIPEDATTEAVSGLSLTLFAEFMQQVISKSESVNSGC